MKQDSETLCIIGLGYVGLPLALAFSEKRKVIGFDLDALRISELKHCVDKTGQVSATDLSNAVNLELTSDKHVLSACNIFIIAVPTPISEENQPDFSYLNVASELVGDNLKNGDLVIYESTVYPGATLEICVPVLAKRSGLGFNKDFFVGYSPERVNPGDKVNTLTKIKKITSGSTLQTAKKVDNIYQEIIEAGTVPVSSIETAEAVKIIENCQREINIGFANEISVFLNRLQIDTYEVLNAASSKWNFMFVSPGLVGGHCIGIDSVYLLNKAQDIDCSLDTLSASRRSNEKMPAYISDQIIKKMVLNDIDIKKSTIGVFGATYKENCPDIRNSKVFELVDCLESWGCNVLLFDPVASKEEIYENHQIRLTSMSEAKNLDTIIVAVGHKEFFEIGLIEYLSFCSKSKQPVFADLKGLFCLDKCERIGFSVYRL